MFKYIPLIMHRHNGQTTREKCFLLNDTECRVASHSAMLALCIIPAGCHCHRCHHPAGAGPACMHAVWGYARTSR